MSNRLVPPGQPDHRLGRRRVPTHITWHTHSLRTCPAQRPNPDHRTNDTRSSVYTLHYRPRPHYIVWGRTSTERTAVVVLRNAATLTVPSRQLLSTRSNVSIVLYGLRPARRCSPGSVATGYPCSPKHDRHPSLSPVTTKLLVTHCVTAFEFC